MKKKWARTIIGVYKFIQCKMVIIQMDTSNSRCKVVNFLHPFTQPQERERQRKGTKSGIFIVGKFVTESN